jgi:hypothetical protein
MNIKEIKVVTAAAINPYMGIKIRFNTILIIPAIMVIRHNLFVFS